MGPLVRTVVLAVTLLVADVALLRWALVQDWPAIATVGAHLTLLAPLGLWMVRALPTLDRHLALLVLATAAFGPIGPAGVLLALALERWNAWRATSVEDWHQMLFPPIATKLHTDLWRRIGQRVSDRAGDRRNSPRVTPFLDVLSFGSVQQRQAVVAIIAQQFRPAFAPALRAALRDEHNVIRVQAATAIARLEQEFLERTLELEAVVREAPQDPDAILALASHCDEQAFAGLFDQTREETCRTQAADGYARYLELRPDDAAVELRLARLQLRRGRLDDAEPRLQRLSQAGHPNARLWLMETLFAQRRWRELRRVASGCDTQSAAELPVEASAAIELWAGGLEAR